MFAIYILEICIFYAKNNWTQNLIDHSRGKILLHPSAGLWNFRMNVITSQLLIMADYSSVIKVVVDAGSCATVDVYNGPHQYTQPILTISHDKLRYIVLHGLTYRRNNYLDYFKTGSTSKIVQLTPEQEHSVITTQSFSLMLLLIQSTNIYTSKCQVKVHTAEMPFYKALVNTVKDSHNGSSQTT